MDVPEPIAFIALWIPPGRASNQAVCGDAVKRFVCPVDGTAFVKSAGLSLGVPVAFNGFIQERALPARRPFDIMPLMGTTDEAVGKWFGVLARSVPATSQGPVGLFTMTRYEAGPPSPEAEARRV